MYLFRIACLGAALAASTAGHALEMSTHNDVRNINSGFEQRLEVTKAVLAAAINDLSAKLNDILARLGVLETDMVAVKARNTQQDTRITSLETTTASVVTNINTMRSTQPVSWNVAL